MIVCMVTMNVVNMNIAGLVRNCYLVPLPKDRRGDALNQRFSTCGSLPPWRSNGPFSGAAYQITYISDIYIIINNGNKITIMKSL